MKVRATAMGHYDNERKRPGDVFMLRTIEGHKKLAHGKLVPHTATPKEQFSENWMEEVPEGRTKGKGKKGGKNEEATDESSDDLDPNDAA